jgi:serine/threonine protein kinase
VFKLAINLLRSLETVHSTGRTYNDLKPENIMLTGSKMHLIDFGLTSKFKDKNNHYPETKVVNEFKGNLIFATVN